MSPLTKFSTSLESKGVKWCLFWNTPLKTNTDFGTVKRNSIFQTSIFGFHITVIEGYSFKHASFHERGHACLTNDVAECSQPSMLKRILAFAEDDPDRNEETRQSRYSPAANKQRILLWVLTSWPWFFSLYIYIWNEQQLPFGTLALCLLQGLPIISLFAVSNGIGLKFVRFVRKEKHQKG